MAVTKPTADITVFTYEGTNRKGDKIKGEVSSKNMALAKAYLKKQGVNVTSINRKGKNYLEFLTKKPIRALDIAIFTRQMATMMKAGVPLVQSFEIVAEGLDNASMRDMVLAIKTEVESGNTFAGSLRKHPRFFDDLFCSLVESGEQSGALETMLERVANYKEKSELLKQKIRKALKYPMIVMIVAIGVTILLLWKVVPVFAGLFQDVGAELPAFTQIVVNMSNWIKSHLLILLVSIFLFVFGIQYLYKNSERFRNWLDRMFLKVPIFGDLVYKSVIARFSRTLSTTFAAGVPLIDALASTAGATGNVVYRQAVMHIKDEVSTGQQLHFAMKQSNLFPSMALQMVAIGEESGRLDEMLDKVATHYENEVDNAVDGLASMMEPLIMVILGILVGGLIVAMYLPIFNMGDVV